MVVSIADLLPPSDADAERATLGAMLLDCDVVDEVLGIVRAEDFYNTANREVYRAVVHLHQSGKPVDAVTVAEQLEAAGTIAECGGLAYFHQLMESVHRSDHAAYHARRVREKAQRRQLIAACREGIADAHDSSRDVGELLAQADSRMTRLLEGQVHTGAVGLFDALVEVNESLVAGKQSGLPTGFCDLDGLTGGFQPGNVIILAARPSVGKTSFAGNLALNVAQNRDVLIVSLEQSRAELTERMLCSVAAVNSQDVRSRNLTEEQREKLDRASSTLLKLPVWIDDRAPQTVAQISALCRVQKRKHRIGLVVIDYLQLIEPDDRRIPREQQVATASRSLKVLAKSLEVPVVCLAQLSREVEKRDSKRPRLSDLRESGSIEQDADLVLFLDRPAIYDDEADKSEANLIVAKHRNGRTGNVKLHWDAGTMTFHSATREWETE